MSSEVGFRRKNRITPGRAPSFLVGETFSIEVLRKNEELHLILTAAEVE